MKISYFWILLSFIVLMTFEFFHPLPSVVGWLIGTIGGMATIGNMWAEWYKNNVR